MRYKLIMSYDGAYFHGFQRQTADVSVQETLEQALTLIFKTPIIIHASGRTDAGVHAKGQVAHFDASQVIPTANLKKVLNKRIYPHIYIEQVSIVNDKFHAQKSAIAKEYHYKVSINKYDPLLSNYVLFFHDRLNISNIRNAMKYIEGTHDFKSFAKINKKGSTIRTIKSFKLDINDGILTFKIIGDGFMYNMVRIIVSLMLKVGEGKFEPSYIKEILDAKDRKKAPYVASPSGLYLMNVFYDDIYDETDIAK